MVRRYIELLKDRDDIKEILDILLDKIENLESTLGFGEDYEDYYVEQKEGDDDER